MPIQLTDIEARILGSLVEKSLTTPDLYPLSLNSLVAACNQKTSRDPVMDVDEATVARTLGALRDKDLAFQKSESGNRVPKYGHKVGNLLEGGTLQEIGAMCVLLLRGPQTPGEIKTRTDRLCEFESVAQVVTVLDDLAARPGGAMVERLPRQSGQKETRYRHLFSGPPAAAPAAPVSISSPKPAASTASNPETVLAGLIARVADLEKRLAVLEKERTKIP